MKLKTDKQVLDLHQHLQKISVALCSLIDNMDWDRSVDDSGAPAITPKRRDELRRSIAHNRVLAISLLGRTDVAPMLADATDTRPRQWGVGLLELVEQIDHATTWLSDDVTHARREQIAEPLFKALCVHTGTLEKVLAIPDAPNGTPIEKKPKRAISQEVESTGRAAKVEQALMKEEQDQAGRVLRDILTACGVEDGRYGRRCTIRCTCGWQNA